MGAVFFLLTNTTNGTVGDTVVKPYILEKNLMKVVEEFDIIKETKRLKMKLKKIQRENKELELYLYQGKPRTHLRKV